MAIVKLQIEGFRNLADQCLDFTMSEFSTTPSQLVCIYGPNGSGKSSLIEALIILSRCRSFRVNDLDLVIGNEKSRFLGYATIASKGSNRSDRLGIVKVRGGRLRAKLNSEEVRKVSILANKLPMILFCPETFNLISGTPKTRRNFLDFGVFHVKHSYQEIWREWTRIYRQRNAVLRGLKQNRSSPQELDIWTKRFSESSEAVSQYREDYLMGLNELLSTYESVCSPESDFSLSGLDSESAYTGSSPVAIARNYETVASSKVVLTSGMAINEAKLVFYPGYSTKTPLYEQLKANEEREIRQGFSLIGPQKADIAVMYKELIARDFFSRGQQKQAIIALYLCQLELIRRVGNVDCLVLIDDFSSELDEGSQRLLLSSLEKKGCQVIFTMLSEVQSHSLLNNFKKIPGLVQMFHVKHGLLEQTYPT
jgi:DNA replication and repair protein RecF